MGPRLISANDALPQLVRPQVIPDWSFVVNSIPAILVLWVGIPVTLLMAVPMTLLGWVMERYSYSNRVRRFIKKCWLDGQHFK